MSNVGTATNAYAGTEVGMAVSRFTAWACQVKYLSWRFNIGFSGNEVWLQIGNMDGIDNVTGDPWPWKSRKWRLSKHMTKSEFVQTCLKAVLTAEEHEVRERFFYRGKAIFAPHFNVDELWENMPSEDKRHSVEAEGAY